MSNYISTKDETFDVKKEYKRLKELQLQTSDFRSITPRMMLEYEKAFVVTRVDDRTGEVYRYDTNLGKRYKPTLSLGELNKNKSEIHPVLKYYYESNNIPIPSSKTEVNTNDLKYLEARIKYEQALFYKDQGDVKTRGIGMLLLS